MRALITSTILSLLLLLVGCSEGSFVGSDANDGAAEGVTDLVPVSIAGELSTTTRVSGSSWESGDDIGVFMTYFSSDTELVKNICYTTTGDGKFSPTEGGETIYYPSNASAVNLYAYYPYSSSVESFGEMDLNISSIHQYDQERIDLLRAYVGGVNFEERDEAILFTFEHKLSKIDVVTYPGDGYTISSLEGISVNITSQSQQAKYVAYTDRLITINGDNDIALVTEQTTDSDNVACCSSSAIIFPQTMDDDCELRFELASGVSYSLPLSGEVLAAGDNLLIKVSVNLKGVETISSNIVAWGESEEHYGVDFEYTPIFDEADLIDYRDRVNAGEAVPDAILLSDITLSTATNWTPIGSEIYPYTAKFNGNGRSISDLTILDLNSSCQALFGVVGDGITEAYIYDLTVTSPNVVAGNNSSAIVGMSNKATIYRCVVDGGTVSGSGYTAGVVGTAVSTLVRQCSSSCTTSDGYTLTPLVGSLREGSTIVD